MAKMAKRKSSTAVPAQSFPLKLTQLQRESLVKHVFHQPQVTKRLESAGAGPQVVEFSHRELEFIAAEITVIAASLRAPVKQRLVAVRKKIEDLFDSLSETPLPATGGRPASDADVLLQFKITLQNVRPPVWRRIQVNDGTLAELHYAIQNAMGWECCHLHQFLIDGERYSSHPDVGFDLGFGGESRDRDAAAVRMTELLPKSGKRTRWHYEYDFGDGWHHEVLFEGYAARDPGRKYPLCLEGARACPPEDCGGPWGYAELVEVLADPDHEEYEERLEWCGPLDPEAFDARQTTRRMQGAR